MSEILEKDDESIKSEPKEEMKRCRYCIKAISKEAKVCHVCRSYQHFIRHNLPHGTMLISIFMLSLSFFQLKEARTKRIEADIALAKAQEAVIKIDHISDTVRKQALAFISTVWLQTKLKNQFGGSAVKAANDEIGNNLNDLLVSVMPDPENRTRWIKGLYDKLPKTEKPTSNT